MENIPTSAFPSILTHRDAILTLYSLTNQASPCGDPPGGEKDREMLRRYSVNLFAECPPMAFLPMLGKLGKLGPL